VTGRPEIPIVLCCAEDDEPALAKILDQLHHEGLTPELVTGVEVDVAPFSKAVDAERGPALFVLCQSMALDRGIARRLTGLFSARRGAGQRIVTVSFNPARPLAILPAIRLALQQAELAAHEVIDDEAPADGAHLRDVVESLTEPPAISPQSTEFARARPDPIFDDSPRPRAPGTDPSVDPERLARELAAGLAEAEAILDRRADTGGARPRPRTPAPIDRVDPR